MAAEKVRITDLRNPTYNEKQRQVLAHVSANPVTLSAEAVMEAAKAATGLSYFGEMDFVPRLELWMSAAAADEGLSEFGRASIFGLATRFACSRLDLEDLIRRHPEIEQVELPSPIMIAGLPRSGTTYMLQLMGADTRLRGLPHWEGIRPVADRFIVDGKDTRFDLAAQEWAELDELMPYMKMIHEFAPDHITEDIELIGTDFAGYYPEWLSFSPQWREYQMTHDRVPWLKYMRRAMQAVVWQKGPNNWVGKCPQHMEQMVAVTQALPGAFLVVNHRDPVASIQSAITNQTYAARFWRKDIDYARIAEYWIDRYVRLLRGCVRDRNLLDESRVYDLYFDRLMADPFGELEALYRKAGIPFDDQTRAAFNRAIADNKRGKHGQLGYDLRGDFDLDPAEIRERFSFYFERFPEVRIEVE
jgi:hypothetical protein